MTAPRIVMPLPPVCEPRDAVVLRWAGRQLEDHQEPTAAAHLYLLAEQIEAHFKEAS
ncbi:hypothetical protein GCM10009535_12590 [Streptomyces thermocarboxydovorans]|jgi:hypothetical protein|uniref:Uncharacterized protein n=1 Tax=Streptomyces thermocarboxydovorans TaxID=59298 RepID=A0ABN1HC52_9ACTN